MNAKKLIMGAWLALAFVWLAACGNGNQGTQPLPTVAAVAVLEAGDSATAVDSGEAEATTAPTNEPSPAASPVVASSTTPYRIAYVAFGIESQRSQVRMMEPDGRNIRLLVDALHKDTRILDWSSDGEWLLLSSFDEGTFALRMDGSQQTVAIGPEYHSFGDISPTSTQAVVGSWGRLQLIDVASGEKTDIPMALDVRAGEGIPLIVGQLGNVAWSPDGDWFVFQVVGENEANEVTETLYRYTVANGAIDTLYTDAQFLTRMFNRVDNQSSTLPLVSPDGTQILTDLGKGYTLSTMPAAGGVLTTIWEGQLPLVDPPSWSPDGEWIAFIYDKDVFVVRADGSEWRQVTTTSIMEKRHVQWSPDGEALIYALETPRGVYELERIDFNSGVRQRLTAVTGTDVETADLNPIPSPILTAEALAQLDNGHPLLPSEVVSPLPFAQEDWITYAAPPANLMNPPWWGSRFIFRRPIHITSDVAIDLTTTGKTQRPLVQLTFDPTLIQKQLYYPIKGLDIRVAWWDEAQAMWVEMPSELSSMEADRTVLTFPLQESVAVGENVGDYYLYYGSLGQLYPGEEAPDLEEATLSEVNLLDDRFPNPVWLGSFNSLAEGEASIEVPSDASWRPGIADRSVVSVQASETVTMPFAMDLSQGTLSFFVSPTGGNGHIFSTVRDSDVSSSRPDSIYTPVLRYDGGAFHLALRGEPVRLPASLPSNQWSQVTFTWLADDRVRLFINGELVGEAAYAPAPITTELIFEQIPQFYLLSLLLGSADGESGLAGAYANVFSYGTSLNPSEVQQFYDAQQSVTVSLGDVVETAVNSAEIDAQTGGTILSPNGRLWIEIPPNALPASTTVSVADFNFAETDPYEMANIFVYPTEMAPAILSGEPGTAVFEQFEAASQSFPLNEPIRYYFAYDPDFVEYLDKVYFIRQNPDGGGDESWFYYPAQVFVEEQAMGVPMPGWGRIFVIKEEGFVPER